MRWERRSDHTSQPIALAIMSLVEPLPCLCSFPSKHASIPSSHLNFHFISDFLRREGPTTSIRSHSVSLAIDAAQQPLPCLSRLLLAFFYSFLASQPQPFVYTRVSKRRAEPLYPSALPHTWFGWSGVAEIFWDSWYPTVVRVFWRRRWGKKDCHKTRVKLARELLEDTRTLVISLIEKTTDM